MPTLAAPQMTSQNDMPTCVVNPKVPYDTHDITFHTHTIQTLLTSNPALVDSWLSNIGTNLIVGLDIEWRPNFRPNMSNPVATLQLCVDRRCLVFQILHAPFLPHSLVAFLADPNHTFVGVGIQDDVKKLLHDYSLIVANFVDLCSLAVEKLGDPDMMRAGLKKLGLSVLGLEVFKPKNITRSKWDNPHLSAKQLRYATIDAFISSEVGCRLASMQKKDISYSNCNSKKRKRDVDNVAVSSSLGKDVNICNQMANESSPRKRKQKNESSMKTCNMHSTLPVIKSIDQKKGRTSNIN